MEIILDCSSQKESSEGSSFELFVCHSSFFLAWIRIKTSSLRAIAPMAMPPDIDPPQPRKAKGFIGPAEELGAGGSLEVAGAELGEADSLEEGGLELGVLVGWEEGTLAGSEEGSWLSWEEGALLWEGASLDVSLLWTGGMSSSLALMLLV